ncbi:MAG: hypothetical protein ABFS23_01890 [Pseudomonadota bacterium]
MRFRRLTLFASHGGLGMRIALGLHNKKQGGAVRMMSKVSFRLTRVSVFFIAYIFLPWLMAPSVLAGGTGGTETYHGWRFQREPDGGWTIWRREAQQAPTVSPPSPENARVSEVPSGAFGAKDVPAHIPGWEVRRQHDGSTLLIPQSPEGSGVAAQNRSSAPAADLAGTEAPRHAVATSGSAAQQQLDLIRDVFGDAAYLPAN